MESRIRIVVEKSGTWEMTSDDGGCGRLIHVTRRCSYIAVRTAHAGTESDVRGRPADGGNRRRRGMVVPLDGGRSRRPARRVGHPAASPAQTSGPGALRHGAGAE